MDTFEQREESVKMHEYAIEQSLTCIDCHKGVAHFSPQPELDNAAREHLLEQAHTTPEDAENVYPAEAILIEGVGELRPAAQLKVIAYQGGKRLVEVSGYQLKGAEQLLYKESGQRILLATLTQNGQAILNKGNYVADEYGNEWRPASLTTEIEAPVLESQNPIWAYADELDKVYCGTCHAIIPGHHFAANAWVPIAKSMGERTDISSQNLEILTLYFQYHAKDVVHD